MKLFMLYFIAMLLCTAKQGGSDRTSCTAEGNECAETETCMIRDGKDSGYCFTVCSNDEECTADGEMCRVQDGDDSGICKGQKSGKPERTRCESDADCTVDGESCMIKDGKSSGRCGVLPTPCTSDADCSQDEECAFKGDDESAGICRMPKPDFCDEDAECDEGLVCELFTVEEEERRVLRKQNRKAGMCVEPEPEFRRVLGQKCMSDDDCDETESCIIRDGKTRGRCGVSCTDDEQCGDLEYCRFKDETDESGMCKTAPVSCTVDGDECEEGQECMDGVCKRARKERPSFCDTDADCDEGLECELFPTEERRVLRGGKRPEAAGKCVEIEAPEFRRFLKRDRVSCSEDAECDTDAGEVCKFKEEGDLEGFCKAVCSTNADCEDGEMCKIRGDATEGVCKPAPTVCSTNEDCEEGETCRINGEEGVCKRAKKERPAFCDIDDDCEEGLTCELFEVDTEDRRLLKKGGNKRPEAAGKCVEAESEPELRRVLKGGRKKPTCSDDSDCTEAGQTCVVAEGKDRGFCGVVCLNDEGCGEDEMCKIRGDDTEGVCKRARVSCTADGGQCADNQTCDIKDGEDEGFCKRERPTFCNEDADCDESLVCELFEVEEGTETRRSLGRGEKPAGKCVEAETPFRRKM